MVSSRIPARSVRDLIAGNATILVKVEAKTNQQGVARMTILETESEAKVEGRNHTEIATAIKAGIIVAITIIILTRVGLVRLVTDATRKAAMQCGAMKHGAEAGDLEVLRAPFAMNHGARVEKGDPNANPAQKVTTDHEAAA